MEGSKYRVPTTGNAAESVVEDQAVRREASRRARRRPLAILAGAGLVAVSAAAVGAGAFVPGFAALGLGALLLLLPPGRRAHGRGGSLRVARAPLVVAGRAVLTFIRLTAHAGARALRSGQRFATGRCYDGARWIQRAALHATTIAGRLSLSVADIAFRAWLELLAAARRLVDDGRAASSATWSRIRPMLGRAWAAGVAGSVRGGHELDALARTASERLSAVIDANQPFVRPVARPPHRAPRRGPREPIPRAPRPRHRRGPRGAR